MSNYDPKAWDSTVFWVEVLWKGMFWVNFRLFSYNDQMGTYYKVGVLSCCASKQTLCPSVLIGKNRSLGLLKNNRKVLDELSINGNC